MRPSISRAHRATSLLGALVFFGAAAPCGAHESPVAVGEVRDESASGAFCEALRSVLTDAMATAELGRPRERFILSATLVRLDAERVGRGARATALVSLVLRRAREQSLHAVLNGHATAEEETGSVNETRADALRAAVTSALRRLPEAVR
ncbi:MAG TPA: hypothetical protein VMI54_14985 [Polyangiaceae bacterium]|nr:hypothetical protein [Polyangiaceae bacterium]